SGNRFGESIDTTVKADLVSNTGSPVSVFRFTGSGNNELRDANVQQQSFNPGLFPDLFVNDVQLFGQPPR
ncbi:MAG: hypothetical protein ACKO1V_01640, partial [Cyanobium sp.]